MDRPFQRKGSKSNSQMGRDFERKIKSYFAKQGLLLKSGIQVPIGINEKGVLVECKFHGWIPSIKVIVWNESMF